MSSSKQLTPGSYISGTHRTQDLIPKFFEILEDVYVNAAFEIALAVAEEDGADLTDHWLFLVLIEKKSWDEVNVNWWHTIQAAEMVDTLINALQNYTPQGHYFGVHPGDGSDFGCWLLESVELYTVLIRESNNTGTTYIDSVYSHSPEEAARIVLDSCAKNWDCLASNLHVLGILKSEKQIEVVEWNDFEG
jgi:hypothetical protein